MSVHSLLEKNEDNSESLGEELEEEEQSPHGGAKCFRIPGFSHVCSQPSWLARSRISDFHTLPNFHFFSEDNHDKYMNSISI